MKITIRAEGANQYRVKVEDGGSSSRHEVAVTPEQVARYAGAGIAAEKLLEASFEFLLEREPKEAILPRFDLAVIEHYYPDYARRIRERL